MSTFPFIKTARGARGNFATKGESDSHTCAAMDGAVVGTLEAKELHLEEALRLNPIGLFQYRLLLMCGFAFAADAMEINLLTFL
jgi:hypothetical protein